jgi:hypothetical protein
MKLPSFLASASLLLVTAVAGCGDAPRSVVDPPDPGQPEPAFTAEFAGASDAQLRRAAIAGEGADAILGSFLTAFFAGVDDPTGCPRIVTEGNVTTVTGGCDADGTTFAGTAVLTNVQNAFGGTSAYDPTQPSTYVFDGYRMADASEDWAFDGMVWLSSDALEIDLVATMFSSLRMTIGADGAYTAAEGSFIDVDTLGTGEVTGAWSFADPPTGSFTLQGADRITFDFDDAVADCVPYTIDDAPAGELCSPEEEPQL